jgi:hypothetical protein
MYYRLIKVLLYLYCTVLVLYSDMSQIVTVFQELTDFKDSARKLLSAALILHPEPLPISVLSCCSSQLMTCGPLLSQRPAAVRPRLSSKLQIGCVKGLHVSAQRSVLCAVCLCSANYCTVGYCTVLYSTYCMAYLYNSACSCLQCCIQCCMLLLYSHLLYCTQLQSEIFPNLHGNHILYCTYCVILYCTYCTVLSSDTTLQIAVSIPEWK